VKQKKAAWFKNYNLSVYSQNDIAAAFGFLKKIESFSDILPKIRDLHFNDHLRLSSIA
jgi:hypothetical protein